MTEIGSDYNINLNFIKKCYKSGNKNNKLYLFSGRNAIKLIKDKLQIKSIMLPNYLCESIYNCFRDIDINFYKINKNFEININSIENTCKYIYIINYFGKIDKNIDKIKLYCKENNIIIIEDYTHNFLDNKRYGDVCIASYRKTLALPYGAEIIDNTNKITYNKSSIKNLIFYFVLNLFKLFLMLLKNIFILKFIWYPLLIYCEKFIDNITYENRDYINELLMYLYDKNKIKKCRIKNYNYLKKHINLKTLFNENNFYFSFPIQFKNKKNRDELRSVLIKHKIYCPIYWDNSFNKKCNSKLSENILFIPIDQRYNISHMKHICKIINDFYKSDN